MPSEKSYTKRNEQLGMPQGTAANRLRKLVMFDLLGQLDKLKCYRCTEAILVAEDLSIEHKEFWMDSPDPVKMFFDINNIAFSHLSCNTKHSRKPKRKYHTEEERIAATKVYMKEYRRKNYSSEARRAHYLRTGN